MKTAIVALILVAGPAQTAPKVEPIDRQPYRISAHLAIDPEARLDARLRRSLVADWLALIDRFVGPPWIVVVAEPDMALAGLPSEEQDGAAFGRFSGGFDKIWAIRIGRDGAGLALSGREFDVATGRVGPVQRQAAPSLPDLPRSLFQFARDIFSPSAVIGERFGKNVNLTVRGAALEPASPAGRVVAVGAVFQPLRLISKKGESTRVLDIPFSFLQVDALEGTVARCSVVSIFADPLTNRVVQNNSLSALGVKAVKAPTRLRFVTKPDKAPAAGYVLTARAPSETLAREVGTTDREGRITIPPGFAAGLVILRLLAGNVEPMVEFPALLGEFAGERTIPIEPRPLTVALETQLNSLGDEVLDLVAVRARLEARLKARFDGEDWAGVDAALKEFRALPARETFADRLARLKDDAARQQSRTKTAVLTKTAQARAAEVQALIDRYLDDEAFKAYAEGLARAQSEAADRARKPPPKAAPK